MQAFVEYSELNKEKEEEQAPLYRPPQGLPCSFSADTEVATKDGEKAISQIQIGDYVFSWNLETGELGFYPVTAKLEHEDETIVHLVIGDEEIATTPEHPFYTEEQGWVDAGNLKSGMHIREADGKDGVVESITTEKARERMYNLTIQDTHTFFVGSGQWLVHNMCPANLLE